MWLLQGWLHKCIKGYEPGTEDSFCGIYDFVCFLFRRKREKKKKNQLTTQLAAIGRFNHGFFVLFIYLLFKLGPNYSFVYLLFNNTSGKDTSYDWTFIKRQSFLWANKTTAPTGTTMWLLSNPLSSAGTANMAWSNTFRYATPSRTLRLTSRFQNTQ